MQEINLDVSLRQTTKKSEVKNSRVEGKIPSIIYGKGEKNVTGFIDGKTFDKIIQKISFGNTIFNLNVAGAAKKAIIKDIQIDVVSRVPVHVDFQVVTMESKIEVSVPVKLVGEAPGVKLHGGILEHFIREIKVKCLPRDIPQIIEVNVSALEIGRGITVGELPKQEGVEYHADSHAMVVNVVAPKKEEVAAPEAAATAAATTAPAEPEVISKGKKEEAEGEGEEPKKEQK